MKVLLFFLLQSLLFLQTVFSTQPITLELIFKENKFEEKNIEGIHSLQNGKSFTMLEEQNRIVQYSYETGEMEKVIFSTQMDESGKISTITNYTLSENEQSLLICTQQNEIYRHSFTSYYYVYRFETGKITPVFSEGEQQIASLSPDGRKVAFVFQNNLYCKDIVSSNLTQITFDGEHNKIINGLPDWVYEEEFTLLTGFYWSPNGRYIAYYRFDESEVKEMTITRYTDMYPENFSYKYPKVGEKNSNVEIHVFDLVVGASRKLLPYDENQCYVPRIKWLPSSDELSITTLNRRQNRAQVQFVNIGNGNSTLFLEESDEKFISEFTDDFITFFEQGESVLIMSERNGFKHLYRYSHKGKLINAITAGQWEVDELLGIDEVSKRIYYTSTEVSPIERHIYSIGYDGKNKQRISSGNGWFSAEFSKSFTYYILNSSTGNTPGFYGLYNQFGKLVRVLEENSELKQAIEEYGFTKKEFFTFPNSNNTLLHAFRILPPNFDSTRKYPVLVYVYGGPESQLVTEEWSRWVPWFQLLARQGYVIVCTDNRGTDGRGADFKKSTYLNLGKYETEDQIAFVKYLAGQPFIDKSRIGIFGWSYGGYMSLLCMMNGSRLFKTGIAVAPVTSWRFYDSAYTERFMRKPAENEQGYNNFAPINLADSLHGKLLLVHGTADDNVHLQNSLMLCDKLVEANKTFEMQFYPNKNHSISGGNTDFHLFNRMTQFLIDNL